MDELKEALKVMDDIVERQAFLYAYAADLDEDNIEFEHMHAAAILARIAELEAALKLSVNELNYLVQYAPATTEARYETADFLPGGCMWEEKK